MCRIVLSLGRKPPMTQVMSLGRRLEYPKAELRPETHALQLIQDIVTSLIHVSIGALRSTVDDALGDVGRFLDVDRVYIFEIIGDGVWNSHEWCADGIDPEIENLQGIPTSTVAHWWPRFEADEAVNVPVVEALGEDRMAERSLLLAQGIKSLLVIPMRGRNKTAGFIGFDAVRSHRTFGDPEVSLLRSLADVLSAAFRHEQAFANEREARRRLEIVTAYSNDHTLIIDDRGIISYASESWTRFGVPSSDLVGRNWQVLLPPVECGRLIASVMRAAKERSPLGAQSVDISLRHPDDPDCVLWFQVTMENLLDDPDVRSFVVHCHDITERRVADAVRRDEAMTDSVTGLGNRARMDVVLAQCCGRNQLEGTPIGVLFLDLDQFKMVNDTHGHEAGDRLLVEVADRICAILRPSETVVRFGGDEFVVIVEGIHDLDQLAALGERLRRRLSDSPIVIDGALLNITASIGISSTAVSRPLPGVLVRDADTAMYRSKDGGRNRTTVFDQAMRDQMVKRSVILQRLPAAIEGDLITVHYQPIVGLETGAILGAEALARWSDPHLGPVGPDEFISLAEESGLIGRLGLKVLDDALREAARWPRNSTVSVNLSPMQLTEVGLFENILERLARHAVDPSRLTLEVTESSVMVQPERSLAVLRQLQRLGVAIAMDDFGTGYSSLSMLRSMPVDILKIDRSFISSAAEDGSDDRLVRAVIGLAKDFGMMTVAEGVETEGQRRRLVELGCVRGQGWLFGRPVHSEEFIESLMHPTRTV